MQTTTETPTTIDLSPLVELAPECADMLARMRAGDDVPAAEYEALTQRCDYVNAEIKAQLFALAIDATRDATGSLRRDVEDDVTTLLDMISGIYRLSTEWDDLHREEISKAMAWRVLGELRDGGARVAELRETLDQFAPDLLGRDRDELAAWIDEGLIES